MPVTVSLPSQTITVGAPVAPDEVSLLSPFATFNGQAANDNSAIELGLQFMTAVTGEITELRYYRGQGDSNDTDIRQGHLWNSLGQLIGTVEFVSAPGESGWQVAALSTPVTIMAGVQYTVSYSTLNNYVASSSFFTDGYVDPYGVISTSGSGGVFSYGPTPSFPVSSFNGSNYWVDVTFAPSDLDNQAPVITSDDTFQVAENGIIAANLTATDADGDEISFAIVGGADADLFRIDSQSGAVTFLFAPDFENPFDANGDNLYELVVSVGDNLGLPTEQAITVQVTDIATETDPGISTLFGPTNVPANVETNDSVDYELGVRFVAQSDGTVSSLRYYRGTADATDTDIRTLNIWTAAGVNLGSVVVESRPGEDGWQVGTLDSGVTLQGGQTYVVSYGTEQNYVYSSGFFGTAWQSADGQLTAPLGGNGVFSAGSVGLFPTQSFNDSNYWVDLTFEADPLAPNTAPVLTSSLSFSATENQTLAGTLTATDANGDALTFSIAGGADAALFALDATSGRLTFLTAPDFETPGDAGADNIYDLVVAVTDGQAPPVQQAITVNVLDIPGDPASDASRLFTAANVPATTITNDPTDYELGVRFSVAQDGLISTLLYYRGVEDSTDTDTRTLNLWSDTGVNLGSVTVVSTPGQSGWQYGELDTPIAVAAGTSYVASYGTEQNYVISSNFFATDHSSDDFILNAPAAGNGVFNASGTGFFPTQSFNASNYWVDVAFEPVEPVVATVSEMPIAMDLQTTSDLFAFV